MLRLLLLQDGKRAYDVNITPKKKRPEFMTSFGTGIKQPPQTAH